MRDKILFVICALGLIILAVELARGQTRLDGGQLRSPRVSVFTCTKPPSIVIDPVTGVQVVAECGGLYYVDVITAAGTELKILGTVQPGPVNAADWRLIP